MKMSYYAQASIVTNKYVLEQMINYIKDLHNSMFGIEHKNTLKNILRILYMNHKNSIYGSCEKEHYSHTINEMCDYVHNKCNATRTQIYETWLKVVFEGGVAYSTVDDEIISYFREFIFGVVQTYQIIFEHTDRKTGKGRYYYVIKIEISNEFSTENKMKMFVFIQDLKNTYNSSYEKGLSMISNSALTDDGFIEFDVSQETLLELAKYTYYEFNNCGFTGGFELYPQVSMIKSRNTEEYINDYIATSQFNKKFLDLLIPF